MPREGFGEILPVDPRMIEEIQSSRVMSGEQGPGWMQEWGGPEMYQEMSQAPVTARMVYYAALEGFTSPDQIEVATGLSKGEVSSGVSWLRRKGYVAAEEVIPAS